MSQQPVHHGAERSWRVLLANRTLLVFGAWLLFAVLTMNYEGFEAGMWSNVAVGISLIILSLMAQASPLEAAPVNVLTFIAGLWLLVSILLLGYPSVERFNNIYMGALTILLSSFAISEASGMEAPLDAH